MNSAEMPEEAASGAVVEQAQGGHYKDEILAGLAPRANIAQFVSFAPGGEPHLRFAFVKGHERNFEATVEQAIAALLEASGQVNVRSFEPHQPRSHEFLYGLTDAAHVVAEVRRLAGEGLYTIVNETIDIHDGGVSGVAYGGVVEFAPDDTPRAVEKPGTATMPRPLAIRVLGHVYGFAPDLDWGPETRVEFSMHPIRRGLRNEHTIVWETEELTDVSLTVDVRWPNQFSQLVGDKVFGLLVAEAIRLDVPLCHVVARRVAPFQFGERSGTGEFWLRTAPFEQEPGRFTTRRGWIDPFALLADEDPAGDHIASVIAQEGVAAAWSGAAGTTADGTTIEGVAGAGESFMQGARAPGDLPAEIRKDVAATMTKAVDALGPVRIEWAHDGKRVWVLQLHRGALVSQGLTIVPGQPEVEHRFAVERGLESLRTLVEKLRGSDDGVVLVGSVGITSHFGDLLRRANVPSRIDAG